MFAKDTKILIADDMKTMRIIVKKALLTIGFSDITEVEDGARGLEEFTKAAGSSKPFGLIVSDWNMPNMQGIDFLKQVRASKTKPKTPFVLLTAESDGAQVMEAVSAGVSSYILKPFTPDQLKEKLLIAYKKHQTPVAKTAA